jgi:hypothetical protein
VGSDGNPAKPSGEKALVKPAFFYVIRTSFLMVELYHFTIDRICHCADIRQKFFTFFIKKEGVVSK